MKKYLIPIILLLLISANVWAKTAIIGPLITLTGGCGGCLDGVECEDILNNNSNRPIADGDVAIVVTSGKLAKFYRFNVNGTDSESSPTIIVPDDRADCPAGATKGQWELVDWSYWPSLATSDGQCLSAAPGSPVAGKPYCVKGGSSWDDALFSLSVNHLVIWDGSSYIGLIDEDGNILNSGIQSPDPTFGDPDTWTMSGVSVQGGTWIATAGGTATLPPATKGYNFTVKVRGTWVVSLDPDATGTEDTIYLSGVSLAQGAAITSDGTAGALCVFQYSEPDTWDVDCDSAWAGP